MNAAGEELAKLHFINSLFADVTGNDLYLATQVKSAIETTLPDLPPHLRSETFAKAAVDLLQKQFRRRPMHGFAHWNCSGMGGRFDPLWARQELIAVFKKLAPYPRATVLVTGLRAAVCPPGRRWTRALRRDYLEAVTLIQEIARTRSTRRAEVTVLFF